MTEEQEFELPDVPEEFLGALKYALASGWDEEKCQALWEEMCL